MNRQEKIDKVVGWFAKSALRHAEAMEAFDDEAAAAQVQELTRFYAVVIREGGVEAFLVLLEDQAPPVAGMAAVFAIREAPERCVAVLKRIAKLPGLIGFRAQVALERWESGEWPT
ncbi:hypothetical protein [Geomonas sp. Red276]